MNIVYLIGNGFDLKIGMETKYEHFYKYYETQENSNPNVMALKKEINVNRINWSDLEAAFGKYTKNIITENIAVKMYNDIIDSLCEYLIKEEGRYDINDSNKDILYNDLSYPERHLRTVERTQLSSYKNVREHWGIKIISFNYTTALEKLLNYDGKKIVTQRGINGYEKYIADIEHIHGYAKERMILGVNDDSQIAKEEFKTSTRLKRRLIKSECNKTYGLGHDAKCKKWIDEANLICLFGLSFGDTDKQWWIKIGETLLRNDCRVILFAYNENIKKEGNWGPDFEDEVDWIKDTFLSKTTLSEKDRVSVMSKIFVSMAEQVFDVKVSTAQKLNNSLTITKTMTDDESQFTMVKQD